MEESLDSMVSRIDAAWIGFARRMIALQADDDSDISLTPVQYRVLTALDAVGAMSTGDIATQLRMLVPAVSRTLRSLEERDLIRRETSEEDRRSNVVLLTPAGVSVMRHFDESRRATFRNLLEALDDSEREAVIGAFERLNEVLARLPNRGIEATGEPG